MLDFLNLKKSGHKCGLCGGSIKGENCSPKSCSHIFHTVCLEEWADNVRSSQEFTCPVDGCSSTFQEIIVRKSLNSTSSTVVLLMEIHQCPICCEPIQKPVATPESCNHAFCYICLKEWSQVRHECPLDRGSYELIFLSDRVGGPITKRVQAPPVKQQPPETPPLELDTNCEVCQRPDDEAHLLLCDHCDRGFHTYCLPTPLSSIPDGDWFCPDCVRHGAAHAPPTPANRLSRNRIFDLEAEESDREAFDTSIDESSSENIRTSRELTSRSQRRLEEIATRRHRGARLLQDLIENLSERVASEATTRARRRHSQRQRVRNQLAVEAASNAHTNGHRSSVQTTLNFDQLSCVDQSVSLVISSNSSSLINSHNRHTDSNSRRVRVNQTVSSSELSKQNPRKRLRVLSSSSDTDSEFENGIVLRSARLTRQRQRLVRPPSESDAEDILFRTSTSDIFDTEAENIPTFRRRIIDEPSPGPTTSAPTELVADETFVTNSFHSESELEPEPSALDDSTFVLSSKENASRKRKKTVRKSRILKSKKIKRASTKRKKITSYKKKKLFHSTRRKRLTKAQKRIKKKVKKEISSSSSLVSPKSTIPLKSHSRRLVSVDVLPRLSVLGNELSCDYRLLVDSDDPVPGPSNQPISFNTDLVKKSQSKSSYLSEIEAGQESLFKFTTRHMQVNPDHSMSPIPISKQPIEKSQSQLNPVHPQTSEPKSNQNAVNTSTTSTNLSSSLDTCKSDCQNHKEDKLYLSNDLRFQIGTSKYPKLNESTPKSSSSSFMPKPPSTYSNDVKSLDHSSLCHESWTPEAKLHAQSVLKMQLKIHLESKKINEQTYRDIFKRSYRKILCKPAIKVTDERITKLANDYVSYFLRHQNNN